MDVIILCGGKGTRLSEETALRPKPMVEIGEMPMLWHIMKLYSYYGFTRFILALGYKQEYIKKYFYDHRITGNDFTLKMNPNHKIKYIDDLEEKDWEITFINTGVDNLKGSRIKQIEKYVKSDSFHITYGDGVSNVNIDKLVNFYNSNKCIGVVTAVRPPSRFGELDIDQNNVVNAFEEKPQMAKGLINGGFFIFNHDLFSYLDLNSKCDFEFGPLQKLAKEKKIKAFKHNGFWQCMDNIRERDYLNRRYKLGDAPWMPWSQRKSV